MNVSRPRSFFGRALAAAGASLWLLAATLTGAAAETRDALPTLFVCGDSTAAPGRGAIQGWGQEIGGFVNPDAMHVVNAARAGRSARTFLGEGLWAAVQKQLRAGDVVLLQFGHNDSKNALSIDRYDLSGTGAEVEQRSSADGRPLEIHTFGYYLRQMIEEARSAGATVVVLSSVPRARWENGHIVRGEEEHARWAKEVAAATHVPYVDANALIAQVYEPIGAARIKALFFPQDNTHTNVEGARLSAACIATGLAQLDQPALRQGLRGDAVAKAGEVIAAAERTAATVPLALPLARAFPAPGATQVCPDTPLRLTFPYAPTLANAGFIHVVDTATGADADTIDLSQPAATKTIGGEPGYRYLPVIVSGTEATIYPRNGTLKYGKTYRVRIDAGVFRVGHDGYAALEAPGAWTFTTKTSGPASGASTLTVAADGTADFCTVQGALDHIPDGNTAPVTIDVRRGTYTEIVFFTNKHHVTIRGEDRRQTVIAYATNDRFNPTHGNPFGDAKPNPSAARVGGHIYHRGVFLAHRVEDLTLANLTIRNTTPQGGSQAEAIILNGTTGARAILKDVDLYSYQDTLQINGQAYLSGCYIEGDIDFMWGTGPCFFERCTCRSLRSGAYYTQIRNPGTNHGYVYVDCRFDGATGIMGNYLSRIGTGRFPHSEVVLLDCTLTHAVTPLGWQLLGGREGNDRDPRQIHFWEFNSHDPAGKPVDLTFRLPGSRRLEAKADAALIENYRNPAWVLGDDWNPRSAPIFRAPGAGKPTTSGTPPRLTRQPIDQLTLLGTGVSFDVSAVADSGGRLNYQWLKNGQPLPGATSPRLHLDQVTWDDAAVYAAIVSNQAGSIVSEAARLTPVAPQATPAPSLPVIPAATLFDVTSFGAVGDGATDNTAALQRAIDAVAEAGGGTVLVPAADKPYLSGPLTLRSNLNLEIAAGATLQMLPYGANGGAGTYPRTEDSYANLLGGSGLHDVALTGAGTINGNGDAWWAAFRADRKMPHRPFLVRLGKSERVLVSGLTFTRSPMFHVAIAANHLTVCGITIDTPEAPNTDGIDPAGSHHLFQNCYVSCGDDNLVMKPGGTFCSDITVADCAFGEGHGLSVGGQSNRGLDGMTVKNCSFEGTTSALRLKADPTQGGEVKNITYTNLTLRDVQFPIVFYSYYSKVGNPGSVTGGAASPATRAKEWNARPPYDLAGKTLPSWKDVTITNLLSSGTRDYSIIWGLPLPGYLIENVKLANVRISGGRGMRIYDATNVQLTGGTEVGEIVPWNALVLTRQPESQHATPGSAVVLTAGAAGPATEAGATLTYRWLFNGKPLADGPSADGTVVSGSATAQLTLDHVAPGASGKYAVTISTQLDAYDVAKKTLSAGALPVSATSASALLTVDAAK